MTGANSGMGKAATIALAKMGATVVMICRNPSKGKAAKSEVKAKSGNESKDLMFADLSSQESIRQLVQGFRRKYEQLDVLVNNTGTYFKERKTNADGMGMTFAVNYLGHFLLTNLLLDVLKASAPARIVSVAGSSHKKATIDFDDLQGEDKYSGLRANSQSKLAIVLFTYELARRLRGTGMTANCLHPGAVATPLVKNSIPRALRFMLAFYETPEEGAETAVYSASSPEVDGVSGKYFVNKKETKSSRLSHDKTLVDRLWRLSET
ncbi:MAG: SDR family oxidoreductase [Candidatus Thermoplasmatota archaeon]|nr:SDR family oxidoreductase [Candidatus Thermoplasmatota archaeon]